MDVKIWFSTKCNDSSLTSIYTPVVTIVNSFDCVFMLYCIGIPGNGMFVLSVNGQV